MEKSRYKRLNEYLKSKYGERTLKICIDGGFTCPNRDGKVSTGGCIFCSQKGSGDHINKTTIKAQVENYLKSERSTRANRYIAYFQNFTNTYDTISNLKNKYDEALIDDRIIVLSVATRPDCITEDICKLLASYKSKVDVWVELGLQTANDDIANTINRGYTKDVYTKSVNMLRKYDIDVITHIMIGLPGETDESIDETIEFINNHDIQGIKIHSTYVVEDTKLNNLLSSGNYNPITLDYYIEKACYILTKISPDIVIHKISGDAPKDILVAPEWNSHKKWIMNGIDKRMDEKDLYQGMNYKNKTNQ